MELRNLTIGRSNQKTIGVDMNVAHLQQKRRHFFIVKFFTRSTVEIRNLETSENRILNVGRLMALSNDKGSGSERRNESAKIFCQSAENTKALKRLALFPSF